MALRTSTKRPLGPGTAPLISSRLSSLIICTTCSHLHRSTGSIGASAYPARVFKNRKMPGHYGFSRVTVQGLQVVQIIREDNLLLIKGAVPGPNGRLVEVRRAIKNK